MALIHKVPRKALHKVHHKGQKFIIQNKKNETDGNDTEIENLTISEIENTTQSAQDSCYSWSGVSQEIDIKGEKRELSDNEEEPWWESFKSQSTQKTTQETLMQNFSVYKLVCKLFHKHKPVHRKMTIRVMMRKRKKTTKKLVFI